MGIDGLVFLPNAHPKLSLYVAAAALCGLVWASVAAGRPVVPGLRLVAAGLALLFFGTAAVYLCSPFYEDHVESSIAIISWLATGGAPVYHAPDAAARYSYLYGPLTFIFNAAMMKLVGANIFASKLTGFCAAIVSGACVVATALRLGFRGTGLAAVIAGFCGLCGMFGNLAYWNRPDSFLLAASSAAVLLASFTASPVTAVLFGLLAGVMVNLKAYAALFAGPPFIFALFGSSRQVSFVAVAVLAGAIACAAPFGLANVDLANYLTLLRSASEQGLNPGEFVGVIGMALVCCLPLILFVWLDRARSVARPYLWAIGVFLLVAATIVVPASKIGAGPHHLLPLVPIGLWLILLRARAPGAAAKPARDRFWVASAATLMLLWIAIAGQGQILADAIQQWGGAAAAAAEVRSVASDPAMRPVQVIVRSGVGLSGKVQPAFLGEGFLLDEGALMDMNQAGLAIPAATVAAIRSCQFRTMLFAAGQAPFTDRSYYHDAPLFNDEIRGAFLASYALQGRGRYFDVWVCKPGFAERNTLTQPPGGRGL